MNRKDQRQKNFRFSEKICIYIEEGAKKMHMDEKNYISYLVEKDREPKDDLYSIKFRNELNKITKLTIDLSEVTKRNKKVYPFVIELKEGVEELWQCLR